MPCTHTNLQHIPHFTADTPFWKNILLQVKGQGEWLAASCCALSLDFTFSIMTQFSSDSTHIRYWLHRSHVVYGMDYLCWRTHNLFIPLLNFIFRVTPTSTVPLAFPIAHLPACTAVNIVRSGLPLNDECWSYPCFQKNIFRPFPFRSLPYTIATI